MNNNVDTSTSHVAARYQKFDLFSISTPLKDRFTQKCKMQSLSIHLTANGEMGEV